MAGRLTCSTLKVALAKCYPASVANGAFVATRLMSTKLSTITPEIRRKMEQYQLDDGVPIHLKGGIIDGIMYRLTMALCMLSLPTIANFIYSKAKKK